MNESLKNEEVREMPGPYFMGQQPAKCGCYYPDVHLRRDVPGKNQRILHCITHGEYPVELGNVKNPSPEMPIPPPEWYESERKRLRKS